MNDKQKRFCEEYVKDHNATQAAIRAWYSKKTAGRMCHILLKKIEIKKYIKQLQDEAIERNKIDVDRVLQEIQRIALLDPYKMFDDNVDVKPINEMDEDTRRAILSFEVVNLDGDVIAGAYDSDRGVFTSDNGTEYALPSTRLAEKLAAGELEFIVDEDAA